MTRTEPFQVAVGLQNPQALIELSGQLAEYRIAQSFERPIFVRGGQASSVKDGFRGLHDILWSAIVHADDVRTRRGAELGLGLVHGPLYLGKDETPTGTPMSFETALLVVTDADGVIDYTLPQEARPHEADFVYRSLSSIVTSLKENRKNVLPVGTMGVAACLLSAVLFHIRPLPANFGILRPLQ